MEKSGITILGARQDRLTSLAVFSLLWVFAGFYGFVYEMIFYYLNGGMQLVYWRGSCFGPWISIYGFGSLLIYFLTCRFREKPLMVFLAGAVGCGAFELISGAALYYFGGHRGWNYNLERWNFGNLGGFICLRSVVVFGVSSLIMVYALIPFILWLRKKMDRAAFAVLAFILGGLFLADIVYNLVVAPKVPGLITANSFYQQLGLSIIEY